MDESNITSTQILNSTIVVPPNIINRNIDTSLNNILKRKLETKCIDEGYVIKGSVKIISRSNGIYDKYNNDGNFKYFIQYTVNICKPCPEDIISCVVEDINKAGIVGLKSSHQNHAVNIKVIIPTEYYKFNKLSINDINIGDTIFCKVIAIRLKYGEDSLLAICRGI